MFFASVLFQCKEEKKMNIEVFVERKKRKKNTHEYIEIFLCI